jgi:hypothetical protein
VLLDVGPKEVAAGVAAAGAGLEIVPGCVKSDDVTSSVGFGVTVTVGNGPETTVLGDGQEDVYRDEGNVLMWLGFRFLRTRCWMRARRVR